MNRRTLFTLALLFGGALAAAPASAQEEASTGKYEAGTRSGPFVATTKSLTDLAGEGYEIRGNLGTALILQKGASIYSCQIPPDPQALDFKPYFVCAELDELPRDGKLPPETPKAGPMPRKGN